VFERFTAEGRRVVVLAQEEASMLKDGQIEAEHILLGLLREEGGLAGRVLRSFELTVDGVRSLVARTAAAGESPAGPIPFEAGGRMVLEVAMREALGLGHNFVGTEHLLLALVRVESAATRIMAKSGADSTAVRSRVINMLAVAPAVAASDSRAAAFPTGLDAAVQSSMPAGDGVPELFGIAAIVAREKGRETIEMLDLLVAITRAAKTRSILAGLGIDEARLRDAISRANGPGDPEVPS